MIGSLDNISFRRFSVRNRVTSDVSRRVPPTLGPQHLEFQYFARHLQYLQQNSDGSFSKIAVFTGPHRGPRPLASIFFSSRLREPSTLT